jgi:small redox-active disulfide protein 2
MKVQILGSGCHNCITLEKHAREAAAQLGVNAEIEKVTDAGAIVAMGVMRTPALAIDGTVKSVGRVLTKDEIIPYLNGSK